MKETVEGGIAFEAHNYILDQMKINDITPTITAYFCIAKSVLFAPIEDKVLDMKHVDPMGTRNMFDAFKKAILENLKDLEVMVGTQH